MAVTCERCGKEFKNNSNLKRHSERKNPCKLVVVEEVPKKEPAEAPTKVPEEAPLEAVELVEEAPAEALFQDFEHKDGLEYLKKIDKNSIDLVLTDPPYIISKETGMNTHYNKVKSGDSSITRTEEEWKEYKQSHNITDDSKRENFLKYGTIYGTKYCVQTDYGSWDKDFTIDLLEEYIKEYFKKLKSGGTLIIFFDLWKIETLKKLLEKHGFRQIRMIEWIKTNPQPLNSNTNYLTNSREVAITCIKGSKPTFNSKYDNGLYHYPLQGGKNRFHPTQKSLKLFEDLIKKHSNEGDTVLDTFLGAGTTLIACKATKRNFKGCEIIYEYCEKLEAILKSSSSA